MPKNFKALRSFFGKIDFIHRFIPNFTEITKPLNKLLKNDADSDGLKKPRKHLKMLKKLLVRHRCWVSPDYSKPFQFYSFATTDTIAGVQQKNDKNEEKPIAFMSKSLSNT